MTRAYVGLGANLGDREGTILAAAERLGPHRLSPIVEYSHLGLTPEQNKQWAVLDTFDMYSPAYDLPQDADTVRGWFAAAGFERVEVFNGLNGIVGRGRRPPS